LVVNEPPADRSSTPHPIPPHVGGGERRPSFSPALPWLILAPRRSELPGGAAPARAAAPGLEARTLGDPRRRAETGDAGRHLERAAALGIGEEGLGREPVSLVGRSRVEVAPEAQGQAEGAGPSGEQGNPQRS